MLGFSRMGKAYGRELPGSDHPPSQKRKAPEDGWDTSRERWRPECDHESYEIREREARGRIMATATTAIEQTAECPEDADPADEWGMNRRSRRSRRKDWRQAGATSVGAGIEDEDENEEEDEEGPPPPGYGAAGRGGVPQGVI